MLLSDFPQEIIEHVADYLSIRDKISCSLVCKSWKIAFEDTIYSDITIRSHKTLQDVMTRSKDNRHKYHEIGHLVRYLSISHYWHKPAEEIYTLQKIFPNIKYLYFAIAPLHSNDFGSMTNWSLWGSLTELHMTINGSYKPIMEDSLVEAITCLPLLRYLDIHGQMQYSCKISFSVNSFEIIHSHLKHLEYMKLSTSFLTLSDTDFERIANVSPATTMKILDIKSNDTDYRWLCYFARKYPNLHTLNLKIFHILPDIKEQTDNTLVLFQQVPVSLQYLKKLNLIYIYEVDGGELLFLDNINFHGTPLKHISIEISGPHRIYSPDNLWNTPKIIAETFLEKFPKTIESFNLKCNTSYTTTIDLTGIENSLCNLVKVNINIPTIADIDTFLRAAPRLKSLKLLQADIKVKDDLYNSERFELQSFDLSHSTITSDVLRFLSFHCRNFDTLNMNYTSVYGSFTTPGCQLIDMTYGRFETVSLENTSFFIKDNKKCPENRNVTLITRQVDGIPPKQEYDPNSLPVDIGETSDKDHYEWIYQYPAHDFMDEISEEQASFITKFVSNYEENKKLTLDKALDTKSREPPETWKDCCVFGYTKLKLGYVADYSCIIECF